MSIREKVNNYLLEKVAKSKVQYLFAVSKETLLAKVHELSERVEELKAENHNLNLRENRVVAHYEDLLKEIEVSKGFNYERAYKGLVSEYEDLRNENKSIKASVELVGSVVENTKKQNEQLKERLSRTEAENERLSVENKKYKEKEKVIDLKQENKKINIRHNYTAARNNSSKVITRQVNN